MGILQNTNRLSDVDRVQLAIRYPGVPIFRFGSQALEDFHKDKWEEWRVSVGPDGERRFMRTAKTTTQYIVDHGNFLTLQTMIGGQCAPRSEDIELY